MEGICKIEKIGGEEWVIFDDYFNQELTPEILKFLSKYKRVKFGWYFDQPLDNLSQFLTHLTFGYEFDQPVNYLPTAKCRKKHQRCMKN